MLHIRVSREVRQHHVVRLRTSHTELNIAWLGSNDTIPVPVLVLAPTCVHCNYNTLFSTGTVESTQTNCILKINMPFAKAPGRCSTKSFLRVPVRDVPCFLTFGTSHIDRLPVPVPVWLSLQQGFSLCCTTVVSWRPGAVDGEEGTP